MEPLKSSFSNIGQGDHTKESETRKKKRRIIDDILELTKKRLQTIPRNGTEYRLCNTKTLDTNADRQKMNISELTVLR